MDFSRPPSVNATVKLNRVARCNKEPRNSGKQERLTAMVASTLLNRYPDQLTAFIVRAHAQSVMKNGLAMT